MSDIIWKPGDQTTRSTPLEGEVYRPDVLEVIEKAIKELSPELRELSLDIHSTFFACDRRADTIY